MCESVGVCTVMQEHVVADTHDKLFHSDASIFQLNSFLMTPSNETLFLSYGLAYTTDDIRK